MKTYRLTGRAARGIWALIFFAPIQALAWNAAGHRIIAAIAWEQLRSDVRSEVTVLLQQHPDHARWLKRAGEDERDRDRRVFIEASTWPDEIRKDKRFYSAGIENPTPTLPGFPDMERRRDWHYVNIPLNATPDTTPLSGQIDRQLVALSATLRNPDSEQSERTYALPWIIHLVGDAHQPLHTSVRLDAEGRWDKLGNRLEVRNPFKTRKPVSTLHAFWDDLPGPPWLRGDTLDQVSHALMEAHPRPARSSSSQRWIEESWRIARDDGYPPGSDKTPDMVQTITEAFFENSREIANRRIVEAGHRLAGLLNQSLKPRRPSGQR